MADEEPAAKRAKKESDEEPEESEDPLDNENDDEIVIDGEVFNVDDLEEESDDNEEESDDDDDDVDDDDESDEEDGDADLSDVLGGNVYVVTHHQESKKEEDRLYARKLDCEIVGVAGSLEKAEDVAREYTEGQFEVEVKEDFHGWFADGFEVQDEESEEIVPKVMIEVHEMKD